MNDSIALLDLKKKSQKLLNKISEQASVNSERAKALLLLSEGATQEEAAEKTALSVGQVRYWLGRYRANGMNCFPEPIKISKETEKKASTNKDKQKTKKSKVKDGKTKKTDKKKSKKTKSK
ncbi:helix-turn-helix domain-containing protein [Methylophaga nitratireducenticrescens]|uniref:Insertion element IS150 protein InsJ-like helix-turn-helix domain-containing protein n=1 Tax=Methylophaga nitratireducenticrescens TaxID=754476 RepID=I1XJJ1_METNJ|nr:helix-turn-helix domain-containing protein [Methylophaga nitratireducenticrescens]AFI84560.1 helix-turn-helix domain-containing protein [Methylophaga nitratireducenticrescens]AUZ84580.1 helix-turn-helix domain-containing protein [Methylophaga nitratireducenticrescens]